MGNLSSSERIELYKLYSQTKNEMIKTIGSPNQKKIKKFLLINLESKTFKIITEYGQRLDLSFIEDEEPQIKRNTKIKRFKKSIEISMNQH